MVSKEFNQSIDSYIDTLRSKKPKAEAPKKKKKQEFDDKLPKDVSYDSIYIIKKPKNAWQKIVEAFTATDEEDFEEEKKQEKKKSIEDEREFEQEYAEIKQVERKEGIFRKIAAFFTSDVNETYEDLDDESRLMQASSQKPASQKADKIEIVDEDKAEPVKEQKSFFTKFLGFFGLSVENEFDDDLQPKEDPSMQKMIEMREDIKELAVIATSTFKKLPKEQFKIFKESSEFEKFKVILRKYNVIKEK